MKDFFAGLMGGTVLDKALFVMIGGLAGVFLVLAVFYLLIVVLERAFRPKNGDGETTR